MRREDKFGYGFLFAGIGVSYMLDRLMGHVVAIVAATGFVVIGALFLAAGHLHQEKGKPQKATVRTMVWSAALRVVLVLGIFALVYEIAGSRRRDGAPTAQEGAQGASTEAPRLIPPRPQTRKPGVRAVRPNGREQGPSEGLPQLTFPRPKVGDSDLTTLRDDAAYWSARLYTCLAMKDDGTLASWCNSVFGSNVIDFRDELRNDGVTIPALDYSVKRIERGANVRELRETAALLDAISQRLSSQIKR